MAFVLQEQIGKYSDIIFNKKPINFHILNELCKSRKENYEFLHDNRIKYDQTLILNECKDFLYLVNRIMVETKQSPQSMSELLNMIANPVPKCRVIEEETKNKVLNYSVDLLSKTFKEMKKTPGKYKSKIQLVRQTLNNLKEKQEAGEESK